MTRQLDMGETEGFDPTGWLHSFRIRITPPEIEAEVQHVLVYLKVPVEELDLSQFVALPRHEFMFVTTDGEEVPFEIVTCSLAGRSGELALILRLPRILSRTQASMLPGGAQYLSMYVGNPSAVGAVQSFWLPNDAMMLNACGPNTNLGDVTSLTDATGNEHTGLPSVAWLKMMAVSMKLGLVNGVRSAVPTVQSFVADTYARRSW